MHGTAPNPLPSAIHSCLSYIPCRIKFLWTDYWKKKKKRPIQLTSKKAKMENRSSSYIPDHIFLCKTAVSIAYRKAFKKTETMTVCSLIKEKHVWCLLFFYWIIHPDPLFKLPKMLMQIYWVFHIFTYFVLQVHNL